jgi:heme-degrading monooxygenase HmoA
VIVRIWRTEIDPVRARDYEAFVRERSQPMFRAQPGFLGVFYTLAGSERAVVTLWSDSSSVASLATSPTYARTVAAIEESGMLVGNQTTDVFESTYGYLSDDVPELIGTEG